MTYRMKPIYFTLRMLVGVFCVLVLAAQPLTASAADSGTIGGRPAHPDSSNSRTKSIFIKTIKPSESVRDAVIVINNTDQEKTVLVYATDSTASSGGAFACKQAVEPSLSVGKWTALEKSEVVLPANTTQEVAFTITAPKDSEPGEQNGCIVLQEKKSDEFKGGVALNFRTAIRVAVMIPGDIRKELTLLDLSVKQNTNKIIVSPSVENTGNVSIDTDVKISIKSLFGSTIETQNSMYPVLRNQVTEWNFELNRPFWGGIYSASYQASYDESSSFLNKDEASEIKTLNSPSVFFFATPHPIAAIIELLVIGGLVTGIILLLKRRKSQQMIQKEWSDYIIKLDDDIQLIAKRYNIDWKLLAKSNHIKAPYTLFEGETLRVPPKKSTKKIKAPKKT